MSQETLLTWHLFFLSSFMLQNSTEVSPKIVVVGMLLVNEITSNSYGTWRVDNEGHHSGALVSINA